MACKALIALQTQPPSPVMSLFESCKSFKPSESSESFMWRRVRPSRHPTPCQHSMVLSLSTGRQRKRGRVGERAGIRRRERGRERVRGKGWGKEEREGEGRGRAGGGKNSFSLSLSLSVSPSLPPFLPLGPLLPLPPLPPPPLSSPPFLPSSP